jgi:hypothetical protein
MAGTGLGSCADLNKNDKLYVTLPIYHASGCTLGVGFAFLFGSTIGNGSKMENKSINN